MKLLFKQKAWTLLDAYTIFGENENVLFTVKGEFAWTHKLNIFDADGYQVGRVVQKAWTWLPKFELYIGNTYMGSIAKEFSFVKNNYRIDVDDWYVEGDFWAWDYEILDAHGDTVATISKELFHWTDTYSIDVAKDEDALLALMFVLAIDAEKCSQSSS